MDNKKSQLSKLLNQARQEVRKRLVDEPAAEEHKGNRSFVHAHIDTSPITTPEKLEETRHRLSRLLTKKDNSVMDTSVADMSFNRQRLFTSVVDGPHDASMRPDNPPKRQPLRNPHASYAASTATPNKARKRVTIEEREMKPEDQPLSQKLNRVGKRRLSRSLSPLPSRHQQTTESQYPQHEMHEMNLEEDDSSFMLDFQTFQDADCKLSSRFGSIAAAVDSRMLHTEITTAASTLTAVGVARVQFWELDDAHGTLSTHLSDGSTASLNPYQSELLLDFSRDSIQSFGAGNADMILTPSTVFTWLPTHPGYQAVRKIAVHGHRGARIDAYSPHKETVDGPAGIAIHALKVICRCPDSPRYGKVSGVLLVTELADPSQPFASAASVRDHHMLRLRRYLVLQLLQKLTLSVENKMSQFDAQHQHAELMRFIEETRGMLGQKELDLHQKDDVIAARESILRAKDMHTWCSDALVACATLLGEGVQQSSVIASAVAKSGCIRDSRGEHTLSNCWVLFKESDFASASGHSASQYPSEHQSVCTVSGFVRDGHNPFALVAAQNKLIVRLLHGDYSAQQALRLSVTKKELHDAGLVVAELEHSAPQGAPWPQTYTAFAVSLQVKLVDRLAYDCPGHCTAQAAVVIVVPEGEQPDLFASHAVSLAHLAQRAFTALCAQYESALRQSLLTIPSAFYDAVTDVKPAPSAVPFSPQKQRGASNVGPVANLPQHQRALHALMDAVNSAHTAHMFAVRRSVLLVSDVCAAHWKLHDPPAESRKLSFLHLAGGSLQSLVCPTVDLSTTSWLQDLYSGKIVYFDSAEHHGFAAAQPEAFNVDATMRGAVSKQSKLASPPYWASQQLLKTLVQAVDPHVVCCALVPIRTAAGLSVLMLCDQLSGIRVPTHTSTAGETVSVARGDVVPFSASYMDALLAAGVGKDLTQAMTIIHQQCCAYWAERDLAEDLEAHGVREQRLCDLVASIRQRSAVAASFTRWHAAAKARADAHALSQLKTVLTGVVALVTHRNADETSDCAQSFLQTLEDQLRQLFPLDTVTITEGAGAGVASGTGVQTRQDSAHLTLQCSVYIPADASIVTGSPGKASRRTLATVKLARPLMLNRTFLPRETETFATFCTLAGEVFSALQRGHRTDFADGDIRSLVFPMLKDVVPSLLGAGAIANSANAALPVLLHWLKRSCGADMVVLRLHAQQPGGAETLLSSEECDEATFARLHSQLPDLSTLVGAHLGAFGSPATSLDVSAGDNIVLKLLGNANDDANAPVGELKVLSAGKRPFSAEHRIVAQTVSYLLAHALRNSAQSVQAAAREREALAERQQLHQALLATQQSLQSEAHSCEAFKARLTSMLSTAMFTDKVAATSSLHELASLVCDGIPALVGVSSAVLLADFPSDRAGKSGDGSAAAAQSFRVILPQSARPSDSLGSSAHAAAANSTMSVQQLQQVPRMFESPHATQCRIDLISPADGAHFGAILLFLKALSASAGGGGGGAGHNSPAKDSTSGTMYALWEGLEDILSKVLSTAIYQATTRIAAAEEITALTRALRKLNGIVQDQAHLEPDIANLLTIKADLEEQRDTLKSEVASLKATVDQVLGEKKASLEALQVEITAIKARNNEASAHSAQRIAAMEASLTAESAALARLEGSKKQLMELVASYSFDQRCDPESVLHWLRDVAGGAQVTLQLVGQNESGVLSGADGVRGIAAAVGEAVRTGMTVEFTGAAVTASQTAAAAAAQQDSRMTGNVKYTRSDGRSADALQLLNAAHAIPGQTGRRALAASLAAMDDKENHQHFAVLCVPNRCATAHTITEHACFVFVKPVANAEGSFSAEERDLLNCAANLSSRTLVQTAAQELEREYRRVDTALQLARYTESYLRRVVALGESLRQREYGTHVEVATGIELGARDLLFRDEHDACVVEAQLWLPPWNGAPDRGGITPREGRSSSADEDALARILSTGQRVRRRSVCWVPLVGRRGGVVAVLRVERKFSDSAVLLDSPVSSLDGDSGLPTVAHLVLTDLEEEMLGLYVSSAVPLLERMDMLAEAYAGVQQAGQAIVALQTAKEGVEDRYALEVSHRLQLEESLKAGAEILGMTHSSRVGTEQLLDATRRCILSFTSSVDCFIIMPTAACHVPENLDISGESGGAEYCTFTSDLPRELSVVFETGDLELAAMQNFRSIRAAGGVQPIGTNGLGAGGMRAWQSWAVRRIQGQTSIDLEGNEVAAGAIDAGTDQEQYTLAVPFALRSGAVAVISVVRRAAAFGTAEKECVTWVSKVLAYCLEVKGGEESIIEAAQQVKVLQKELAHLREVHGQLIVAEEGVQSLERSLSHAKHPSKLLQELERDPTKTPVTPEKMDRSAVESVAAAARATFNAESVSDVWVDTDSPAGWHHKLKPLPKVVVGCENGTVTYWIDAPQDTEGSVSTETGPGGFREGETRKQLRHEEEARHAAEASVAPAKLFLQVVSQGLPKCWVGVILEPRLAVHLQLRVTMLMQLLHCAEPWRQQTITLHQQLCEVTHARQEESAAATQELEQKDVEIEKLKVAFVSNLGGTKDKYKSIVNEKSASYRRAEKIFTETLLRAHSLRAAKWDKLTPGTDATDVIVESFYQLGRVAQNGTGLTVSVGRCSNATVSAAQLPPVSAPVTSVTQPVPRTSSFGGLEGVQWLSEPSQKAPVPTAAPAQHSAIHVELYGGKAHTNPLQIALATGNIILFVPEGDCGAGGDSPSSASSIPATRDALLSVCRKLNISTLSTKGPGYVCLNPTEDFPLYSIIVPFQLVGTDSTMLVVVRPTVASSSASAPEDASKYVLYAVLAGVLTLKQSALDLLQHRKHTAEMMDRCKHLAVQGMKRSLLKTELSQATKALVFEKMRSARLTAKLAAAQVLAAQLSTARAHVRHLEQLNADWTEMVKGITGASGGIQTGVAGLWAQACPTLMDLLSSHVKLKDCGLIVPAGDSIVEYTVREVSTPLPQGAGGRSRMFSPATVGELPDYSRGSLESRPVSELGNNVHALASDILAGHTGSQRLFKMARGSRGGDDAWLWLVPVRTARTVLGVLRVSVDLPATAAPTQPSSVPSSAASPPDGDALETAQSNLINFAEVLAPLHLAAQLLDRTKQRAVSLEQETAQASAQTKSVTQDLQLTTQRMKLLGSTMRSLGVLSRSDLSLPFAAPEECLRIFCNRLAVELSQQLSGRVIIHIHRNILSDQGKATGTDSTAPDFSLSSKIATGGDGSSAAVTEQLCDAQGKAFGTVTFAASNKDSDVVSPGGENLARKLYARSKVSAKVSDAGYVLQTVSVPLSGLLLRTAKEINLRAQVTAAEEAVQVVQEALHREQESAVQLQQVQEQHVVQSDFYRGLAEVLNQCLVYCSADQEERFKYPGDGVTYTFAHCSTLLDTLSNLSAKLPALVGNSCAFNFSLLDSKPAESSDAQETTTSGRRSGKHVTWVHRRAEDSTSVLDWHNLTPEGRELVINLAHSCISKRVKSVCDIGVNLGAQHGNAASGVERLSTVRVLSYPLVDQNSSVVLGVVQCLVEPVFMRPLIENLCEDVANCVACVLSVEMHQQRLCGKTQMQKLELLTIDMKCNEVLQLKEMWQQRSRAWCGLCQLAAVLTRASIEAERFSDIIGSEAVVSILSDTGVRMALRPGSIAEAHRQVLASGTGTVLAHAVIPVTESGDLVAEIVCEKPSLGLDASAAAGAEGVGVSTIAAELVETVADLVRAALAVHRLRQQEATEIARYSSSAVHKIDKLKGELRSTREQLQVASNEAARLAQDVQRQTRRYERLKTSASTAVADMCTPAMGAVTKQIEELCGLLGDESAAGRRSETVELSKALAALTSSRRSTSPGKGFGEAKQPDAAGGDAQEDPDSAVGSIMQPVSAMVTALQSALERLTALHKQQAAEKKQEVPVVKVEPPQPPPPPSAPAAPAPAPVTKVVVQKAPQPPPTRIDEETARQIEHSLQQLSRARKVHRVVCREAAVLLDPPLNPNTRIDGEPVAHPASLTPLAASQDSCLKLLGMVRTLLRSEGQSLLLRDPGTDPVTYQVIYTGDSLHWAGIGPGTFGVVSSSSGFVSANGTVRTSLAETAMHTRKTIQATNAPMDARYYAYVDGICDLGTPMLVVPMRGRGGAVVGVLIAARGKDAAAFGPEDIVAAEICSTLGALSLYWCQGMGALHHQLVQNSTKMARLEKQLDKLQHEKLP